MERIDENDFEWMGKYDNMRMYQILNPEEAYEDRPNSINTYQSKRNLARIIINQELEIVRLSNALAKLELEDNIDTDFIAMDSLMGYIGDDDLSLMARLDTKGMYKYAYELGLQGNYTMD